MIASRRSIGPELDDEGMAGGTEPAGGGEGLPPVGGSGALVDTSRPAPMRTSPRAARARND